MKNMIFNWDSDQLAYYRFKDGDLKDAFRNNKGTFIYASGSTNTPDVKYDNTGTDMCYAFNDYSEIGYIDSLKKSIANGVLDDKYYTKP